MGVVIPSGFSQASLRWSVAGDAEFMVATLGFEDLLATGDPNAIATRMGAAWDASTLTTAANILAGWSAARILVTTMLVSGPVTLEAGTAVGGTAVTVSPPINTAVLVRKNTALGGRRNRGRMFLPPAYLPETEVNQVGTIDPARVTAIQALVDNLLAEMASRDLAPVLLHDSSQSPTDITTLTVQPKVATQRTRLRR